MLFIHRNELRELGELCDLLCMHFIYLFVASFFSFLFCVGLFNVMLMMYFEEYKRAK